MIRSMILSQNQTYRLPSQSTVKWLNTANDQTIVYLIHTDFSTKSKIIHMNIHSAVLYQWEFDGSNVAPIMPNQNTVLVYNKDNGLIQVFHLNDGSSEIHKTREETRGIFEENVSTSHMNQAKIYYFIQTKILCIITYRGKHLKTRKTFTYYQYPFSQSIDKSLIQSSFSQSKLDRFQDFTKVDSHGKIIAFQVHTSDSVSVEMIEINMQKRRKSHEPMVDQSELDHTYKCWFKQYHIPLVTDLSTYPSPKDVQVFNVREVSGGYLMQLVDIYKGQGRCAYLRYNSVTQTSQRLLVVHYSECRTLTDMRRVMFGCCQFAMIRLETRHLSKSKSKECQVEYLFFDLINSRLIDKVITSSRIDIDECAHSTDQMVHYWQTSNKKGLEVGKHVYYNYQMKEISLHFLISGMNMYDQNMLEDILQQLDYPQRPDLQYQ